MSSSYENYLTEFQDGRLGSRDFSASLIDSFFLRPRMPLGASFSLKLTHDSGTGSGPSGWSTCSRKCQPFGNRFCWFSFQAREQADAFVCSLVCILFRSNPLWLVSL
jgi:hypothetical protein